MSRSWTAEGLQEFQKGTGVQFVSQADEITTKFARFVVSIRSVFRPGLINPFSGSEFFKEKNMTALVGSCHCGAVRLTLPSAPDKATRCNCSMCRRIGAVYAYFEFGTVQIDGHPESTETYIWGDRTLQTVRCGKCGCATHWEPLSAKPGAHMGVNLNNFPPGILDTLRIRNFDGADTWSFVD